MRGLPPLRPAPLAYDKPPCASLDGFTMHAATRAGALDVEGREKLLRYVLRPPIAQEQERVEHRPDGLVRLLAAPNVTDVRGFSMFGMSLVYVLFEEGTDV